MKVEQTSNLQLHRHPSLLFNGLLMRIWRGLGIAIDSASDPKDLAKINSGAELANSLQLARPTVECLSDRGTRSDRNRNGELRIAIWLALQHKYPLSAGYPVSSLTGGKRPLSRCCTNHE